MKPNLSSELLDKAQEAAKQYQRAELFWNCSSMSEEEIQQHRQRFFDSYSTALSDVIKALFPENAKERDREQSEEYLKKQGLSSIVSLYREQKEHAQNQKMTSALFGLGAPAQQEKKQSSFLDDPSLSDNQKKGLQAFHQWMYRNCDRQGIKGLGKTLFGADGSARNFVERFMSQPPKIQLRAMYLLEHDQRKNPNAAEISEAEEKQSYKPDLNNLKKKLTANKFKFWKRTNGSYLYWHKLNEALEAAEELEDAKENVKEADGPEHKAGKSEARENAQESQARESVARENGQESQAEKSVAQEDGQAKTQAEISDENTETFVDRWENISEAPGTVSDTNYAKELIEEVGTSAETIAQHIKDGWKKDPQAEEPDGYITRLVKKFAGDKVGDCYNNISSIGTSTLTAVAGVISMVSGSRELHSMRHVQGTMERVKDAVDLTTTGLYSVESSSRIAESVADFFDGAAHISKMAGKVATGVFGGANLLLAAKGGLDFAGGIKGKKHAERAKELAEETKDEKMKNRAEFAGFLNNKKRNQGIRSFIQGSAGVISAGISLFGAAIPVVGQVAGIVSVSMALYDGYVKKNQDLQEKYRKGIDSELFQGGKDLERADAALKETYKARIEKLKKENPKSAAIKKLEELCQDKNKEKRYDILRKEKAVQEKCVFLRDCYEKTISGVGEEAYRNVFYIDPKKGGKFENLITAENYQQYFTKREASELDDEKTRREIEEHNKKVAVRLSYKELMESYGAKTEFLSRESEMAKLKKKDKNITAEQFQREMEGMAESRKKKVAKTFERM